MSYDTLWIFIHGASSGNPGPSGAGAVLMDKEGTIVSKTGMFLGEQTNQYAEYAALIIGLGDAYALGTHNIKVLTTSQSMALQVQGKYRVKSKGLKPMYEQVMGMLPKFNSCSVDFLPERMSKLAYAEANYMSFKAIQSNLQGVYCH